VCPIQQEAGEGAFQRNVEERKTSNWSNWEQTEERYRRREGGKGGGNRRRIIIRQTKKIILLSLPTADSRNSPSHSQLQLL
jgi:ribosomal protein L44E